MSIFNKNGTEIFSAYDVDGTSLSAAYDVDGLGIMSSSSPSPAVDYTDYSIEQMFRIGFSTSTQDFSISNGVIFQCLANISGTEDRMATVDIDTETKIADNIESATGHGNGVNFLSEKYSQSDDFPLLFVSTRGDVWINRVTTTSSTLVKQYKFAENIFGGTGVMAYDEANKIGYLLSYANGTWNPENNNLLITKWDFANIRTGQDGILYPLYVSSMLKPFIALQGVQFHDGLIWVASGETNVNAYVYAIDPSDGSIVYTIDTQIPTELEGLCFISDTEMILGFQAGYYYKVTFAEE